MTSKLFLTGSKEVVSKILDTRYLIDIQFCDKRTYNDALKNGFTLEKFQEKSPGIGVSYLNDNQEHVSVFAGGVEVNEFQCYFFNADW